MLLEENDDKAPIFDYNLPIILSVMFCKHILLCSKINLTDL